MAYLLNCWLLPQTCAPVICVLYSPYSGLAFSPPSSATWPRTSAARWACRTPSPPSPSWRWAPVCRVRSGSPEQGKPCVGQQRYYLATMTRIHCFTTIIYYSYCCISLLPYDSNFNNENTKLWLYEKIIYLNWLYLT